MDRSYAVVLLVAGCAACGTTADPVDGSADATENDVVADLDSGDAADAIEEWRLCSFDAAIRGGDAGIGQYYSCCAGSLCYGDCLADGGPPRCDCGGIVGGCDQPSRCCGDLYADVLLLACGQQCVFSH